MQQSATGKVKWFDPGKGYGFLESAEGTDLFVHCTALPPGEVLSEGDEVEFTVEESPRGPNAVQVIVLSRSGIPPRSRIDVNRPGYPTKSYGSVGGSLGETKRGTVRRYDGERGFGFIQVEHSNVEVFVHRSAAGRDLSPGDPVEFRIGQGPKGPRAEQVRVVETLR